MSGSPILDASSGKVVGIVATGYDLEDSAEPLSYGSMLWPAAGLKAEVVRQDGTEVEMSLLELARSGVTSCDDSTARVEVDKSNPDWQISLFPAAT